MLDKILEVFTKEYKEEIEYRKFMKQHIQSVNISEENFSDPRLTEPSDGKIYDYRGINNIVQQTEKPLSEEEAEQFRVK